MNEFAPVCLAEPALNQTNETDEGGDVTRPALIHSINMLRRSSVILVIIENVSRNSGKSVGACWLTH